ncbi:MAG: isochorismate synthase [Rhodocyclaceae bacterium]|nr:isochorismate synthase [Rhodocyclaceae bacterium]
MENKFVMDWALFAQQFDEARRTAQPTHRLISVTIPLSAEAIPVHLSNEGCFWHRGNRTFSGTGRAFTVTATGANRMASLSAAFKKLRSEWHITSPFPPLAFMGFSFDSRISYSHPLPDAMLWVPELLLTEVDSKFWMTFSCPVGDMSINCCESSRHMLHPIPSPTLPLKGREKCFSPVKGREKCSSPVKGREKCFSPFKGEAGRGMGARTFAPINMSSFLERGRAAVNAIAAGEVQKLVLSRALHWQTSTPVDVPSVLECLATRYPTCTTFGIADQNWAFVGASPETLLCLTGTRVEVDALAGTAWNAASPLESDKNRREHEFVAQAAFEALSALCTHVTCPTEPDHVQIGTLSHLRQCLTARLPPDVSVFDLIARLHPSPAIGGTPATAALDWLVQQGEQRPAWYTGGFGWIDANGDCDIACALRCGLIEAQNVTLYAGAGFVAGSDPEQEFAETEAKFAPMLDALSNRSEKKT